jgi:DNA polymerase elongation subunit (family B)
MSNDLQTDSLDLNSVAEELIGKSKKEVDIGKLGKAWDKGGKDLEKFCEYNLNDSIITYEIFEKVLPNLNELTRLVGQPIYDVCRMSYGQLVENYLLKRVKEFNEIYPNRPSFDKIRERIVEKYQGAFVFEPKPGLYKNLVVFDFKSLYPTILVTYNICPSTLSEKRTGYSSPEILIDKKKVKYYFDSKRKGFFPEIVKELIIRRDRIKTIIKKEKKSVYLSGRSYALKILANSIYGYLGFFGARWYSRECAESITAFARKHIMDLIEEAQKEKFHVVYSDTDSLYITLDEKNKKDALDFLKKKELKIIQ